MDKSLSPVRPRVHHPPPLAAGSEVPRRSQSAAVFYENSVMWTFFCRHVRCNLDVCPELMSRNQRIVQSKWLILIPHEDKVDVVSPFSILVIGGGGFWSLMMIRWCCFLIKITVFKVSFTCHRGLISPLALLGFANSQQHRIVSVMSQWWVWANVKVADDMFNLIPLKSDITWP